ncbi:hypothetical protein GCM10009872_62310 [Actinopolymorpha rutila]
MAEVPFARQHDPATTSAWPTTSEALGELSVITESVPTGTPFHACHEDESAPVMSGLSGVATMQDRAHGQGARQSSELVA